MTNTKALLNKTENGFNTLNVSKKYVDSSLKWLKTWLTDDAFKDYVPQITYLIEAEKWAFLLDSFYQVIPFGTGGRRGLVGVGPNRINTWTIQASAQGHSQYLIRQYGEQARQRGVVLAFDVRKYIQKGIYDEALANPVMNLDGRRLANAAAAVYAANKIKVYMFKEERSTPELSYAIRHLKAVSGDMFSASHNLPTDNGKKVYDQYGGQLIPPDDQILVDEVAGNVTEIKRVGVDEAKKKGLIEVIDEQVDDAYYDAACRVSLSDERHLKIVYSPLHGTGLTSVYPILRRLDFDITLDPETSNMSGAFENVTFNIPNPEVIESFDRSLPFAREVGADILISTDPDADRIGVMIHHNGSWQFLTGNEIGIILTNYAISKYRANGRLNRNSVVVKTVVTTSLMQKIALENEIQCIGDHLVGFKYIADEMNKIEKEGKIDDFIFGAEESHGYLTGNYARDKDAACAAIWLCEHAAELKKQQKTLLDDLNDIYATYGYCHNYLTEIRLLGAKGMEQISLIMDHLRDTKIGSFDNFRVKERFDRRKGDPQPHLSKTDTSARNMLIYHIDDLPQTAGIKLTVRPSGTEPKIKMYFEVIGKPCTLDNLADEKKKIVGIRQALEKTFMQYCYRLLEVDFPDRGFLLFWQLPLDDKLKYFEIEDKIVNLKNVSDVLTRKNELDEVLSFLGANPVEKVDNAFREKYSVGILEYLELSGG
ncbi:MAG: phospho-sugar mutase [Desulfobacterales bacterium]|jgi:phosphoglucomutase/phosphomannomutase